MRHLARVRKHFFVNSLGLSLSLLLSLGVTLTLGTSLRAENPESAPVELTTLINQINTAANSKDLKKLQVFYSPQFTTSDGLTYDTLAKGLTGLWDKYKDIAYTTTIKSWNKDGDKLVAETVTNITGTENTPGRKINLKSTITSKDYFKDQKLVYQEIITENTEITAGDNPPKVEIRLPKTVKVGQEFDFDVIVQDPLGDDVLAGAALNEKITSDLYLAPGMLGLDLLAAGGIFKRATAPATPQDQWFSAIIVRGDGITVQTQRLKVKN